LHCASSAVAALRLFERIKRDEFDVPSAFWGIWGIGMGASNPDARVPAKWRGENLLGFALMAARETIAAPTQN
jgi:hypothetical protein